MVDEENTLRVMAQQLGIDVPPGNINEVRNTILQEMLRQNQEMLRQNQEMLRQNQEMLRQNVELRQRVESLEERKASLLEESKLEVVQLTLQQNQPNEPVNQDQEACNKMNVCQRFKENAQTVFKLHHACFKTGEIINPDDRYTDVQVAKMLFRTFGCFIEELSLEGGDLRNETEQRTLLLFATKNCTSSTLRILTLDRIVIDEPMRWILPLLGLFCRLSKLELHLCRLSADFGKFVSFCHIPTIQIYSMCGSTDWMIHKFWHLKNIILLHPNIPESAMNEFLKLNKHLKSLVMYRSYHSSRIFETIARHIPDLRGLSFSGQNAKSRNIRKNVLHLARLKSLTNLTLKCNSFSIKNLIGEFMKETIQLSELNIHFGTVDMELIEKLSFLKTLKYLQLRRVKMHHCSVIDVVKKLPDLTALDVDIEGFNVSDIKKMLPFAENLAELTIGSERSHVQIGIDDYQSILRILKSRNKKINLFIMINSERRQVFVPQSLLQESIYWLKIVNEIQENFSSILTDTESEFEDSENDESDDDFE